MRHTPTRRQKSEHFTRSENTNSAWFKQTVNSDKQRNAEHRPLQHHNHLFCSSGNLYAVAIVPSLFGCFWQANDAQAAHLHMSRGHETALVCIAFVVCLHVRFLPFFPFFISVLFSNGSNKKRSPLAFFNTTVMCMMNTNWRNNCLSRCMYWSACTETTGSENVYLAVSGFLFF